MDSIPIFKIGDQVYDKLTGKYYGTIKSPAFSAVHVDDLNRTEYYYLVKLPLGECGYIKNIYNQNNHYVSVISVHSSNLMLAA